MDDSRKQAIENEITRGESSRGDKYNYVDSMKLARLGITRYSTKRAGGNNFIRIVTPNPTGFFGREIWTHSDVGADGLTFICLEKMFNKPCSVCEMLRELKQRNSEDSKIEELYPRRRYLFFVVDTTSNETQAEGVKWFDCPITIKKNICTLSKDKRTGEIIDVSDPVEGRDIEFVRTDGTITTYSGFNLVSTGPIPDGWYRDLPNFDDVLLIPSYEEIKRELCGGVEETKVRKEAVRGEVSTRTMTREEVKEEIVDEKIEAPTTRRNAAAEESDKKAAVREPAIRSSGKAGDQAISSVQQRLDEIRAKRVSS